MAAVEAAAERNTQGDKLGFVDPQLALIVAEREETRRWKRYVDEREEIDLVPVFCNTVYTSHTKYTLPTKVALFQLP